MSREKIFLISLPAWTMENIKDSLADVLHSLVCNSPFSATRCRLQSWCTFGSWGDGDLSSIPVVSGLLCWCDIRGRTRASVVIRMSEAVSDVSGCDNNRVRQDDTAGITTDLTRLQKQNTVDDVSLLRILMHVLWICTDSHKIQNEGHSYRAFYFCFVLRSHLQRNFS